MKKIYVIILILLLSQNLFSQKNSLPKENFVNYNDYIQLKIGNKFFYSCSNWTATPPYYNCLGSFKLKIVITGTTVYSSKTYYTFTKEIVRLSGTCDFDAWMFPFYVGSYNAIRIDSVNGMLYYYNPANPCSYLPNETLLDSLKANLNDTVRIKCVQNQYFYKCTDTSGVKKFYNDPFSGQGEIRRVYTFGSGLTNNYQYRFMSGFSWTNEQTLIGRVVNGIVYGDTAFTFVGLEKINSYIPENYYLGQNYPNPFNPRTVIKFVFPPECGIDYL